MITAGVALRPELLTLVLAYTPGLVRQRWAGLIALVDELHRQAVREASEPILVQMRLAWWRDSLAGRSAGRDPILAAMADWPGDRSELVALVDAFEGCAMGEDNAHAALADALLRASQTAAGLAPTQAVEGFANAWASLILCGFRTGSDGADSPAYVADRHVERAYHPLRQLNQAAKHLAQGTLVGPGAIIQLGFKQLLGH